MLLDAAEFCFDPLFSELPEPQQQAEELALWIRCRWLMLGCGVRADQSREQSKTQAGRHYNL
jgi:hypothetical protein